MKTTGLRSASLLWPKYTISSGNQFVFSASFVFRFNFCHWKHLDYISDRIHVRWFEIWQDKHALKSTGFASSLNQVTPFNRFSVWIEQAVHCGSNRRRCCLKFIRVILGMVWVWKQSILVKIENHELLLLQQYNTQQWWFHTFHILEYPHFLNR